MNMSRMSFEAPSNNKHAPTWGEREQRIPVLRSDATTLTKDEHNKQELYDLCYEIEIEWQLLS